MHLNLQVKVPLGGSRHYDDDGDVVEGKTIDMIVEGDNVYIVSPFFRAMPSSVHALISSWNLLASFNI
jgi:hypothetical protein